MTTFEYTALNRKGKKESGLITADSKIAAGTRLRKQDKFLVSISEIDAETTQKEGGGWLSERSLPLFARIKGREITLMTRQLATLVSAGFTLVSALETLILQTPSKPLVKVISRLKNAIEEGGSLSGSLALYPSLFSNIYINMVKAGESSGTLDIVLERLADLLENQEETRSKIQSTLAYPVLMAVVGALVLLFLLTYIVPGLVGIFADMNQTLPGPTRLLIAISHLLKSFWWAGLFIAAFFVTAVILLRRTARGALFIDRAVFRIPRLGSLVKKTATARFARVLGSLLQHGVPVLTALSIARSVIGNRVLSDSVTLAEEAVQQGGELGAALEQHRAFPPLATQMIKVGEKSGTLESMLEKTAVFYEKEVATSMETFTALLEPLIIVVMGAVVGFVVLSVCLPIFEMNQLVR